MARPKKVIVAETTAIKASSRASVKVGDNYYTIEFTEERSVQPGGDVEEARANLWDTVNGEVDQQIADILEAYGNKRKK